MKEGRMKIMKKKKYSMEVGTVVIYIIIVSKQIYVYYSQTIIGALK